MTRDPQFKFDGSKKAARMVPGKILDRLMSLDLQGSRAWQDGKNPSWDAVPVSLVQFIWEVVDQNGGRGTEQRLMKQFKVK